MIRALGIATGAILGSVALLIAVALLALMTPGTYEYSLAHQRSLHADMIKVGNFVEDYRREKGSLPGENDLEEWLQSQTFSGSLIEENVRIVQSFDQCVLGENSDLPNDGHSYRLCYWNNWTEEYAPQTGAHTFALTVDDYYPSKWEMLIAVFLVIASLLMSYRLLRGPKNLGMQPS